MIVIGEAHEVEGTYGLEVFIIEDMMTKGYQYILYEGGISEVLLLNEYLSTGNEEVLDYTRARGVHYGNYMKSIYTLKKKYPKLTIKGVDFERAVCLGKVFSQWFSDIDDDSIVAELINIYGKTKPKKVKEIILNVREDLLVNELPYRELLGSNFDLLRDIILNPVFQADFGLSSKKRDEAIKNPLQSLDLAILFLVATILPIGTIFGRHS